MNDMDAILSDEPIEPVVEEPEVVAEEPEKGKPVADTPKVDEPAAEPEDDPRDVELRGLKAALAETRAGLRELKAEREARPDVQPPEFIDPEGASYLQQQMVQMQAHMAAEKSEILARAKYGDEVIDEAFQAAEAAGNIDTFKGTRDPWGALAKWHQTQKVLQEVGDNPDTYKERLRAEIMAEVKAELVAEQAKATPNAPSLASEPNLGTRATPAWSGPASLDDILGTGS